MSVFPFGYIKCRGGQDWVTFFSTESGTSTTGSPESERPASIIGRSQFFLSHVNRLTEVGVFQSILFLSRICLVLVTKRKARNQI